MPQALSLRVLVAVLVAVVGRDRHGRAPAQPARRPGRRATRARSWRPGRSRRPAPWRRSRPACPTAAPTAPRSGCTATARPPPPWRCSAPPASRRRVVRRFDEAARHPLVLSWPVTKLGLAGPCPRAGLRAPRRHVPRGHAEQGRARRHRLGAHRLLHPPRAGAGARPRERRASARRPDRGPAALLGGDPGRLPARRRARAARARRSCCCTTCAARRRCAPPRRSCGASTGRACARPTCCRPATSRDARGRAARRARARAARAARSARPRPT